MSQEISKEARDSIEILIDGEPVVGWVDDGIVGWEGLLVRHASLLPMRKPIHLATWTGTLGPGFIFLNAEDEEDARNIVENIEPDARDIRVQRL